MQVVLFRKRTLRVSKEQLRARRLFALDACLAVLAMALVAWLRLAEVVGIDTVIFSRMIYVAILCGSIRLLLTLCKLLARSVFVPIFVLALVSALVLLLPIDAILGTRARLGASGIIEPVRGDIFPIVMLMGLPAPVLGLFVIIRRKQLGTGLAFCGLLVLAICISAVEVFSHLVPEAMAVTWFVLVATRLFPNLATQSPKKNHALGSAKRSRSNERT